MVTLYELEELSHCRPELLLKPGFWIDFAKVQSDHLGVLTSPSKLHSRRAAH